MAKIIVVDDDQIFSAPFVSYLEDLGHHCQVAETLSQGLQIVNQTNYDIVFLDVFLPDASGLEGISKFKQSCGAPEIVIVTGKGDSAGAEIALTNGAWDYLVKPPSYSNIKLIIKRALRYRENKAQFAKNKLLTRDFIIGNNPKLRDCLDTVAKAAKSNGSVLITGETGTGKELIAKAVHSNSGRSRSNFVTVDCTNIPVNLVENILFGHVKGVFTGADNDSEGLIQQADGGTLFLDEIADLPLSGQKSLLGALQNKKFRALGAKKETNSNFRVIAATNKDLLKMQEEGLFRKDLYYRLVTYHVHLPPLRDRLDDIELLTRHYLIKICKEFGINKKGVSKDFSEALRRYNWPGNIRELINLLHSTIANATNEPVIYPHHLPINIRIDLRKTSLKNRNPKSESWIPEIQNMEKSRVPVLKEFRKTIEAVYLDKLITLSDGNAKQMCLMAGISRSGLYQLLEKHGKKLKLEKK